jgi:hypothetical protein
MHGMWFASLSIGSNGLEPGAPCELGALPTLENRKKIFDVRRVCLLMYANTASNHSRTNALCCTGVQTRVHPSARSKCGSQKRIFLNPKRLC